MADRVIQAVKSGAIRRFFLIAGCEGARSGRSYYTELAQSIPQDCIILTLACSKYRFNKLDSGEIGGLPRLLDIGQCKDTYSALQIALALAKAFDRGVNDLRLSLVLSWYEQKALGVLLTLLHLRVRNIRIGPTLQRSSQARCLPCCARSSTSWRPQPRSRISRPCLKIVLA